MAAHMSKLHISSETPITIEPDSNQEPPAEREKRLVMCEEMRRLQTESIIPSALMKRYVLIKVLYKLHRTSKYRYH